MAAIAAEVVLNMADPFEFPMQHGRSRPLCSERYVDRGPAAAARGRELR
jgi:hypothetical protein